MATPPLSESEYARRWLRGERMDPSWLEDPFAPEHVQLLSMPADAVAQSGGTSGVDPYGGAPPGNVPDAPIEQPGAGGTGGTLNAPPINLSGSSGPGNLPENVPQPPTMAASEPVAPPAAPGPVVIPETTVRAAPKPPARPGAVSNRPVWLNEYAAAEGLNREPTTEPHPLGIPNTPQEAARQAETEDDAFQAAITEREAAIERGRLEANAQAQVEAFQATKEAEDAKRKLAHARELEGMEQQAHALFDDFASDPIDPDRYWNSLSTGEQIGKKLALVLGTIGAGVSGAPNLAYDQLKTRIDQDLAAQAKNKEVKLRRALGEQTFIDAARARFADEDVAHAVAREAAYRNLNAELLRWQQLVRAPEQAAALDGMIAQANSDLDSAAQQRRMAMDAYTLARLGAGQKKGKKPPRDEVKKLVEGMGAADTVIKQAQRLIELTGSVGQRLPGSEDKSRAEALRVQLMFNINKSEKAGTFDEGTTALYDKMLGSPEDLFRSSGSQAKLEQLIQSTQAKKLQLQREFEQMQAVETSPAGRGGAEGSK